MCAIVVDHPLLDSLKSIGETSFDHVEVNRPGNDCTNIAGPGSATRTPSAKWASDELAASARAPSMTDIPSSDPAGAKGETSQCGDSRQRASSAAASAKFAWRASACR